MDPGYLDSLVQRGVISDDVAARLMTHQAEQPNPVRPIVDAARSYLQSGDFNPVHEPGTQPADYLRELFRNPDILAKNVQQASQFNFGGMANPTPVITGNAARIARINEMLEQGHGTKAIAEDIGVGNNAVQRWLAKTGQKTVASENPFGFWKNNPGSEDQLIAEVNKGTSFDKIADKLGADPKSVWRKFVQLRDAGEFPDYQRQSNQSKSILNDPDKRADLIRLAKEGTSQGDIASYFYGGPGGKHPRRGGISQLIKQLQDQGELQDYIPQGGTGLTAAGKTPTLPKLKSQAGPAPDLEAGEDWAEAMRAYLKSR